MARCTQSVFIIRLWWERAGGTRRRRGYVEHLESRQRFYFSDIGDALEFVAALGLAAPNAMRPAEGAGNRAATELRPPDESR